MTTSRRALLARRILVFLLVPTMAFGQIPPAAQETLDQLQNTPGLSISTAPECCPPPSIWDHLGIHQIEDKIHATADQLGQLPLIKGLCQQLMTALGAMGLAESPAAQAPLPGGPTPAGGGDAGAIAQKIEADKKAADDKVKTLEYLAQQDCNAYPEIVPAVLQMLDDPIERVRYAALVTLQKQCRELRCSTLPATRLRYRLHDEVFIDHCRQCASCACQQQVIKRLSDLLLDETALGYPKENSPRVRSLAAAILERCLQIHPVEPKSPRTPGVQPDPVPPPIPDPQTAVFKMGSQNRFPNVPLLQRRPQADSRGWWRRLLGDRTNPRDPNRFVDSPIIRGQSPDVVFNANPGVQSEDQPTWKAATESEAASGFQPVNGSTGSAADAGATSPDSQANAVSADDAARETRTNLLRSIVSEAEAVIRATAADREGASREQFDDAVATLCRARLALALDGDQEQADNLYADAAELCGNLPNSTPAIIALDAVTRYYAAKAGEATADGRTALKRYAAFLGYRIVAFDDVPEFVAWDLYQAARRLQRAGLTVDAARSLQQIVNCCPHHAIAPDSAELLAAIESPTPSDDALAADRHDAGIAAGMAGLNRRQSGSPSNSSAAAKVVDLEPLAAKANDSTPAASPEEIERLHLVIAEAEQAARANLATREGAGAAAFEQAVADLFEARLQLALMGDEEQFRELNNDAQGLCTHDPKSRGAEIAMQALTRYFKAQSGEESEQSQKALRYYACCLRYFMANFEAVPPEAAQELLAAASALRRIGSEDQAIASLQSIVAHCGGTTIADEAGVLLAEFETPPTAPEALLQEPAFADGSQSPGGVATISPTAVGVSVIGPEELARLNQTLADAEAAVQASFADRLAGGKEAFESALALLCETRLQLALQGDQNQFKALYEDAETMCKEAPSSGSAEIAMDALTTYYRSYAGESTTDERDFLRRYAGCLRYRVARFTSAPEASAQALLDAGDALQRCGLSDDAALCYRGVAKSHAGTELVAAAATRLQTASVPATAATSPGKKSNVVSADAETGTATGSAVASTSIATESVAESGADEPQMLDTVVTTRSLTAPPPPAPPADNSPLLSVDDVVGTSAASLEPLSDPFGPNPLGEDVVERAQRALQANEFAYLHLQEEDNIVERYNNSIGVKMAPYSMFHIVGAEPGNIFKLRFSSVYGYDRPDRAGYFWKKIIGAPKPNATAQRYAETGLNYQQILVYQELSSGMASVFNEYPIYLLDPEQNPNTAGPGNLVIGLKAVMIKDENWTVTSVTKTFTPVGNPGAGLGNGHMSLEQGVAIQLRAGRETFAFSDLRFHYPIGGNPDFDGQVLIGGFGFNHVLWTDPIAPPIGRSRAMLLTCETVVTAFLDGRVTYPGALVPQVPPQKDFFTPVRTAADMTSFIQNVGLRSIWTKRFSTGCSIGFPLSASHLYDFSALFEMQWVH